MEISGVSPDEFVAHPKRLISIIIPEDRHLMFQHMRETKNDAGNSQVEFRIRHSNGQIRHIAHSCRAVIGADGCYLGRRISNSDITARKQMEIRLKESELRYKTLFETAKDAIFIMRGEIFIDCNAATLAMFRCRRADIINRPPYEFSPPTQPDGRNSKQAAREYIASAIGGHAMLFEWWHQRVDGEIFYAEVSLSAFNIHRETYIVAFVRDISERKLLEQQLEQLAQTDVLTGLHNRRHFLDLAEREMTRAQRYNSPLSIAMIDLDHFKAINDTFGHLAGDEVLRRFAQISLQVARKIDIVGRLGGEEFMVLFPETNLEHAFECAERIRSAVSSKRVVVGPDLSINFSVSIGITMMEATDSTLDQLISRADSALYRAKNTGRNRVCRVCCGDESTGRAC
jgi:diguanylate cyclase (GGDEF)-like protein/PAS domain S-box-containing protein